MTPNYFNLALNLKGLVVGKWTVIDQISHKPSSGGNFSVGYVVEDELGYKGFLKALDYSEAFGKPNQADILNHMTSAYIFERDLLGQCCNKRLKHVVKIIDYGQFSLPPEKLPAGFVYPLPVDYMVLEMAENSVRSMIDLSLAFDYAWALRSLHNVAVGIEEMHGIQIAHQDIKPSNILLFDKQHLSKLGDVGRSSSLTMPAEHDKYATAGDRSYSPFEQLYGEISTDWRVRRFSCDMFMFGNLIMTYFNNISITTSVLNKLPRDCWPGRWGDSYSTILPQLHNAFVESLAGFNKGIEPELRTELIAMIQKLCCPDVSLRGEIKNAHLGVQQYSLQRTISQLDFLAKKYEFQFKKVKI